MTIDRFWKSAAPVLLAGALLAACAANPGPGPTLVQPGAPGSGTRSVGETSLGVRLPHTQADVRFMQLMIPHHEQALILSALANGRTTNREILLTAQRIEISQIDEIALMRQWLAARGEEVPPPADAHAHHMAPAHASMPGMLSPQQFARIEAATGREFDRLFLLAMIGHHEGAIDMVAELFATPGAAQEEDIFQIASHVEEDQQLEIARMNRMLQALQ